MLSARCEGPRRCRFRPGLSEPVPQRSRAASGPEQTPVHSLPSAVHPADPPRARALHRPRASAARSQRPSGGTRPLAGRSGPQGPLGCAELGTRRASDPRPGSLDSEILVKVSKLPVHSLDVPAETRRPWGRGARSFFACDLVTLGGPGCPLGSRSPRGCQGLRETECSCVVSSEAPPGGSYVNGGSW